MHAAVAHLKSQGHGEHQSTHSIPMGTAELAPVANDPNFTFAADFECAICDAVYRVGIPTRWRTIRLRLDKAVEVIVVVGAMGWGSLYAASSGGGIIAQLMMLATLFLLVVGLKALNDAGKGLLLSAKGKRVHGHTVTIIPDSKPQ